MTMRLRVKRSLATILAFMLVMTAMTLQVFATSVDVLDGQVSITDTANSNTESGGKVTIKAKGGLFDKKTNNITITNETDKKAELSFTYSVDKANSFQINSNLLQEV